MMDCVWVFCMYVYQVSRLSWPTCVFLCKQKTAYEMRISDWSSDVCSSDLVDGGVVGDVVPVVAERRGIERQHPDGVDAELGDVVEPVDQSCEVADAVAVAVLERLDVQLVDDRVLVPLGAEQPCARRAGSARELCRGPMERGGDRRNAHRCQNGRGNV